MQIIIQFQDSLDMRSEVVDLRNLIDSHINLRDLKFSGLLNGIPCMTFKCRLLGGKGGFGKLLKSQKNIGKKTDNFDSCRDLSGRRLRDANKEEKNKKLREMKAEQDKIAEAKKASESAPPAQVTLDEKYIKTLAEIEKSKAEAVSAGFKQSLPLKSGNAKPPKKLAFFDDD